MEEIVVEPVNEAIAPETELTNTRSVWESPRVSAIATEETAGGLAVVAESDDGLLS